MEIREKNLTWAQQRIFRRLRLFDFNNQVGLLKHSGVIAHESRPGRIIIGIWITSPGARTTLDNDPVTALDKLVGRRRKQRDAIFLAFDFFGDADCHEWIDGLMDWWTNGITRFELEFEIRNMSRESKAQF